MPDHYRALLKPSFVEHAVSSPFAAGEVVRVTAGPLEGAEGSVIRELPTGEILIALLGTAQFAAIRIRQSLLVRPIETSLTQA